jgi:hypothetical protein
MVNLASYQGLGEVDTAAEAARAEAARAEAARAEAARAEAARAEADKAAADKAAADKAAADKAAADKAAADKAAADKAAADKAAADKAAADAHLAKWNVARAMIQHEDTLIHHRLTHFLTTQAFLFAAAALAAKEWITAINDSAAWPLLILILCIVGLSLGCMANRSLRAAINQIVTTRNWWMEKGPDKERYNDKWWDPVSQRPNRKERLGWRFRGPEEEQLKEPDKQGDFPPVVGHVTAGSLFTSFVHILMGAWIIFALGDIAIVAKWVSLT